MGGRVDSTNRVRPETVMQMKKYAARDRDIDAEIADEWASVDRGALQLLDLGDSVSDAEPLK